ncbi:hypothetical protein HBI56_009750 [Parastagonospora nodorum]|uniref:Uncharacterized protein n=1 Tax=Phaeosphaeria nodorum (strain SN15 / ATCC MYA-4574 / FGSC 10173) TaxID=321614 RepID=A0A7U2HUL0_PHANO|nr:hypothetical protein HBH56_011980 [Parastagonospora nodorum]QRC90854.1 hypothetical protein JI435_400630 [Parastagonospora nodorum SN15]KAH3935069.1 hypothetical protein HBH54_045280 [Parastagonospora nodorum]KAH4042215.1 hypothetical protein HBI09_010110 [Parastagonospora nodorum]KAH4073269.1 hypothetical protein HBH50_051920 [Parastagonospora nodorum]
MKAVFQHAASEKFVDRCEHSASVEFQSTSAMSLDQLPRHDHYPTNPANSDEFEPRNYIYLVLTS